MAISLAERYTSLSTSRGYEYSVYIAGDHRKGCTDGDFRLKERVAEMRDIMSNVDINFRAVAKCLVRIMIDEEVSMHMYVKYPQKTVNVNIFFLNEFMGFWLRRSPFTYCWARVCGAILIFISRMCLHC